ncbi:MAG: cytochrome c-type biogenesis protein CcmE [Methanomethylovorans sp. PtaU1.Bin093]|uniref:cytochrome c maturation protein CcmE domain-containing protein n=1 Tax=Methanomethylovorans sp. PtaU1.Bin093 TaxID=1811679 RepID=UPI0009D5EB88|nr:cytochrome c maturation protein CcmE [Methanomethylovorans sp. PtaU1.Bin093]OPY22110.1 MAG: cytochrome c-type biogenesis protein CcmE [Methanomethylovorans sp. PtaU1.Bin093]
MEKQQKTIAAILFVTLVAVIGLWGIDLSQGYSMVSELTNDPQSHIGDEVNTMGNIKNGTLQVAPGIITFLLVDVEDHVSEIQVEYTGDLPANFAEGQGISLSGTMVSAQKIEAHQIVMGCPSKYTE